MIEDFYVPEDLAEAKRLADLLTKARVTALLVLREGPARYSNTTSYEHRTVYWQSADWLSQHGLVAIADTRRRRRGARIERGDGMVVTITDLGRWVLARRLGWEPDPVRSCRP